jgi:2-isopropylmalate synthase
MTERVRVLDTTLRDGEQAAGVCFSWRDKVEIARRLAALRVDVVEAGFPASCQAEMRAVTEVARAVRGARVCALARAVAGDVDAAGAALRHAEAPRIHVFIGSSEVHLAHQLRRSREDVLAMAAATVRRARDLVDDVEFSPMDATRSDPELVVALARAVLRAGARTLNVPDTVGVALPSDVAALVARLLREVPELEAGVVSFHGQDDLGLATANALAAVEAGARQVEVTVNGIGERAGNTSFEEVAAALRVHGARLGVESGVDLSGLSALSALVAERSGIAVPPNKAVVGRNAFRHASGVHQDGILKHRATYESIDPAWFGHATGSEIVLGKLSGRAGFASRAAALGFDLHGASLERAFVRFQALAERTAEVDDDALRALCAGEELEEEATRIRSPGFALDL